MKRITNEKKKGEKMEKETFFGKHFWTICKIGGAKVDDKKKRRKGEKLAMC